MKKDKKDNLSSLDKLSFFFYPFAPMQSVKKISIMCNIDKKFRKEINGVCKIDNE